ncbi:LCP family protein [Phormidium sp. CLA17]|uniref:LCP family protein n=1 Tax=Leptolyngbya sp. Cla-17 TaxID=2803751 RepID=UPI001492FA99|nr:LCP family protein [Leptolyngbya sp. Cla-17]MBM0743835.1 LCP family protein [Leptolyngbya sp. Cla-17]
MKQVDTNSPQTKAKSDSFPPQWASQAQTPSKQVPLVSSKQPSAANWLQKAFALGIVTIASTTIGLTAALLLPLPMGLVAKDKITKPLDLWQFGVGYQVSRPVNILVMGIDRVPTAAPGSREIFNGRSDTMLLLRVNPDTDSISLLSVPRDTQVEIPSVGITKINDANVQGGATLAARTASSVLNGVQIDRYLRVSTEAFKELVNLMGGVEVYVPQPMVYEDKTQKLKINLSPGKQVLNGSQAEQFARFRGDDLGDIGRVQRQQALLKALRKQLTSPSVIPRIPRLVQAMQKYIDTNLTLEEMLALVSAGRKLGEGNFKMVMLPGRFSSPDEFRASYWIMDPAGRDRVMKQYFDIDPLSSSLEGDASATALRISIQNASRNPNAASQLSQRLISLGFSNVVIASDWADRQAQTQVIAQRGDLQAAQVLQQQLGLGTVDANSTGDLESDITIRVGDDWGKQAK